MLLEFAVDDFLKNSRILQFILLLLLVLVLLRQFFRAKVKGISIISVAWLKRAGLGIPQENKQQLKKGRLGHGHWPQMQHSCSSLFIILVPLGNLGFL